MDQAGEDIDSRLDRESTPPRDRSEHRFIRKVMLLMLISSLALTAWMLSDVVLLVFGAVLLALLLRGLASALSRWTHLPTAWAVAPVVLGLLVAIAAVGWLFGSQVGMQFDTLAQDLPQSAGRLLQQVRATSWGTWALKYVSGMDFRAATQPVAGGIAIFFGSAFKAAAYLAVMLFSAVYLAAEPDRYRLGILRLVPRARRERAGEMLALAGATLQRWLVGQSITMAAVGVLTGTGLWALGVSAPLALGLIAGMFAFVPYVGPIVSAAPGLLMAATQGPLLTLYAAAIYAGVHFIEGNLVTPFVQSRAVELPPVLTLCATLVFGVLFGTVGVFLAAPLTVVLLVAVNALYLEDTLGEVRVWPPLHEIPDHHSVDAAQ